MYFYENTDDLERGIRVMSWLKKHAMGVLVSVRVEVHIEE